MVVIIAGVLLGFVVLFFGLLLLTGAFFLYIIPLILVIVVGIQTFLRIRDRNA